MGALRYLNDNDILLLNNRYYYRLQGKVMFSQAYVILSTISLMATGSLLILVTAWSVCMLLECFLVTFCVLSFLVSQKVVAQLFLNDRSFDIK